jgi:hypothetical protein
MSKRNENRRALGRTGEKISILGLGGYHIGVPEAAEGIATAAATGNYERFKTSTQFDGTPPPQSAMDGRDQRNLKLIHFSDEH